MVFDWNWIKKKVKENLKKKIEKEKTLFRENREFAASLQKKMIKARQESFEKEAIKQARIRARIKAKLKYGKKQKARPIFDPLIDSSLLPQLNLPKLNKTKKRKRSKKNIWEI